MGPMGKIDDLLALIDNEDLVEHQLRVLAQLLTEKADRMVVPTHRIAFKESLRPKYLAGCPGTVGKRRGRRTEFFPSPGTRAHRRGPSWKVTTDLLEEIA